VKDRHAFDQPRGRLRERGRALQRSRSGRSGARSSDAASASILTVARHRLLGSTERARPGASTAVLVRPPKPPSDAPTMRIKSNRSARRLRSTPPAGAARAGAALDPVLSWAASVRASPRVARHCEANACSCLLRDGRVLGGVGRAVIRPASWGGQRGENSCLSARSEPPLTRILPPSLCPLAPPPRTRHSSPRFQNRRPKPRHSRPRFQNRRPKPRHSRPRFKNRRREPRRSLRTNFPPPHDSRVFLRHLAQLAREPLRRGRALRELIHGPRPLKGRTSWTTKM